MLPGIDPNFYVEGLWFVYSAEQLTRFWSENDVGKQAWAAMEKKVNVKRLAWIPIGPYCFASSIQVKTPEDFPKTKARYVSKPEQPNFKALNVPAVSVMTGEVYTALERKMITSLITIPSAIKGYSIVLIAKNLVAVSEGKPVPALDRPVRVAGVPARAGVPGGAPCLRSEASPSGARGPGPSSTGSQWRTGIGRLPGGTSARCSPSTPARNWTETESGSSARS